MITIDNVYKRFPLHAGLFASYGQYIYAVNGVSMTINENESYGLVGESGSGKTTIAKIIAGVYNFDHGRVIIDGVEYRTPFSRPQSIQYIFQDPAKSLNPRQTVYNILTDGYRHHLSAAERSKERLTETALEQLRLVGLGEADLYRRPTEFSGGQRQRIAIARALIYRPRILICDEVVSALDVSIRAQIITLLLKLRAQFKMTVLFIAHDLSLVSYFCDRVGVLYRGTLVEEAESMQLLKAHRHPYTERLFRSIPHLDERVQQGGRQPDSNSSPATASDRATVPPPLLTAAQPTTQPASWDDPSRPRRMRTIAPSHTILDEPL